MSHKSAVEFENDRVRVTRVKHSGPGSAPSSKRHDRLIIYLTDGHIKRKEGGEQEVALRRAGDVVWRGRSEHEIEISQDTDHEVLIVELKS